MKINTLFIVKYKEVLHEDLLSKTGDWWVRRTCYTARTDECFPFFLSIRPGWGYV